MKKSIVMRHSKHVMPTLSAGTMADIAFLLLTFYMVTTEIKEYKGLSLLLPPDEITPVTVQKNDRNIFTIHINSQHQFLIEGVKRKSLDGLRNEIKEFILNYKKDPRLSDSPKDAVVSIKTDRGTTYKTFIHALDEAQAAYYEIYANRIGVTPKRFLQLNSKISDERKFHEQAKEGIPMSISIAEMN
jgi:biopolymer transport protein ExbD